MLWYALTMLFVGGTILSHSVEERTGIATTQTTAAMTVSEWIVPVRSLSGLAPPKPSGESYVVLDEPDTVDVGGTEVMEYSAAVFSNVEYDPFGDLVAGDSYYTCRMAEGDEYSAQVLPAPCIFVTRTDPVEHAAGEYVQSGAAATLQGAIAFSTASLDSPVGLLTYPIQQGMRVIEFGVKVATWNYSFLEGDAVYFKMLVLWPLSTVTAYSLFRITLDVIAAVRGVLR